MGDVREARPKSQAEAVPTLVAAPALNSRSPEEAAKVAFRAGVALIAGFGLLATVVFIPGGGLEAGIIAGVATSFLIAWLVSPFVAYRYGKVSGTERAEVVWREGLVAGRRDLVELVRRTGNRITVGLVAVACVFGVMLITPLFPVSLMLAAVPAFLAGKCVGFRERTNAIDSTLLGAAGVAQARHLRDQVAVAVAAAEPVRQAAERGAEAVKHAMQGQDLVPPLHLAVDLERGMLEVGERRLPVADILEASVAEKREDGMASTVATVVGVSALGPLGLLLGRAARDAKLTQRVQIALKLTVDDPQNPIRVLEITPVPLPINSPLFQETRRNAETVAAQLRVLRARRDRSVDAPSKQNRLSRGT